MITSSTVTISACENGFLVQYSVINERTRLSNMQQRFFADKGEALTFLRDQWNPSQEEAS